MLSHSDELSGNPDDFLAVEPLFGCRREGRGFGDKSFEADIVRARLCRHHPRVGNPPNSSRRCPETFPGGDYWWRKKSKLCLLYQTPSPHQYPVLKMCRDFSRLRPVRFAP
jgi:hypothetical protein